MADALPYRDREAFRGEEEEEEEEVDETGFKAAKDAVLFAIDVSKSMLQIAVGNDEKKAPDSATSAALKVAYQLMQQRIITNPRDMMGILLFGTQQSRFEDGEDGASGFQYPHCYLLSDLGRPEAGDVKRLRSLVEDDDEAEKLLVPSSQPVAMANVLFCANQIFTTKAPNFASRRLFLVTDNDNPHPSSKELRSSAVVRAKDLYDLGVVIELFPISSADHDFDRAKFYDDIVYRPESSDPEAPAPVATAAKAAGSDGMSLLQSLLSSVMSRNGARRAQFSNMPLEIGPGLTISVKGFIIFKRQTAARACYCYIGGEKTQIVEGKTVLESGTESVRVVSKPEIRKAFKFGGETVTFTPDELTAIRHFDDPVLRVIGFKPLDKLPIWANLRPSLFLYPSEEGFVGSTRTFSALYQSLRRKNKFALCWHVQRKNAAPVLAALVPGDEVRSVQGVYQGEQLLAQGLWLVRLPFADDIRSKPDKAVEIRAPDRLVDKAREFIQQLQLPKSQYDPFKYPNPALQWHYRVLQAMALDEDVPEQAVDATVPRYRQIDKRAGALVVEWGHILDEELRVWQQAGGRGDAKRSLGLADGPPAKKAKVGGASDSDMRAAYAAGTLGKLTAAALKEYAKQAGIRAPAGAKKQELVDLVEQHFEQK